jgi:transposase-like protein
MPLLPRHGSLQVSEARALTHVNGKQAMDLMKLIDRFGSEDRCREYLKHLRWPDGPACVKCGSKSLSWISTRNQFDCNSCRARFSVTSGTVFHDSHLPLRKWFLATYMMVEAKKGVSANQLKRTLATSYKTAWYLCHRIRSAMAAAHPEPLEGTVEIDETFIGGKVKSGSKPAIEAARRKSTNKVMVIGAIEEGGALRLEVVGKRNAASTRVVDAFLADAVVNGARLYSDQSNAYSHLPNHESVDHSADEWVRGDVTTNGIESAWSLLKRSIIGSYHQLSEKHLAAYLDEFEFRFNNRENPFLFRDTLMALCQADALPYAELTQS